MVLSAIDWMNGLMNVFFSANKWMNGLMNDLMNGLMKVFFSYWMNEFSQNFYLQVDALGLANWEWCEGGRGHTSFHIHMVGLV